MARNTVNQDEEIKYRSKREIISKLLKYLKPFKLKTAFVILLMIFVMICNVVTPYLLKVAIDNNINTKDINGLIVIGVVMVMMNILAMIASKIRIDQMGIITNTILVNIRHELYTHIQKLSFSFFDNRPVGKILARVIGDVNSLQELFSNSITNFIPEILNVLCVAVIMLSLNYKLALCVILSLPILAIGMVYIETVGTKKWQVYRTKRSNLNAFTHENFSGMKVVQSFTSEKNTSKSFYNYVKEMMDGFVNAVKLNDLFWPIIEISSCIGSIILFVVSANLLKNQQITIGTIIAFTSYITMFWRPIFNISSFYNTIITNFSAAERIFEILDVEPTVVNGEKSFEMPEIKGRVEFKDVNFYYDDGKCVLNKINFAVKPGETVALVGPTGSGKTTIVNLISRFYDCQSGEVLIDNINVKNVEIESLRSQMGIMLQDTFLFSDTIKENIRYGKLDATDEEVMNAAKAVNAHNFIMKLPKGYDTNVNERGSRLSVGQRQLISFARALLANPKILILDEATSNIDTATERLVQIGIENLLKGRTSFVIAHRLSTIRNCDKIMVIDKGDIYEAGTHDELLEAKGLYYDLYMSQYKFLSEGA